jgi:hypothetical protein
MYGTDVSLELEMMRSNAPVVLAESWYQRSVCGALTHPADQFMSLYIVIIKLLGLLIRWYSGSGRPGRCELIVM